jgi:pleckstrin homology domain-containing family G member 5
MFHMHICMTSQTQDKHELMSEILASYSRNGLPRMPDLLTLGRPHLDPAAFHLERHWTDIVAGHERLNKRQRDQQEAVWELLSTEIEYIRKLRVIIDVSFFSIKRRRNR